MTTYSFDVLLFLFETSLLVHVQFYLLLPDLHTGFSRGRSGGLVFPSLSEFSTVYCDPHSQRLCIVNKAEIDVFLELSCFFDDPADVGNFISGSSAFSKTSLNIWKFMVHVLLKPGLENFKHYFTSVCDECNCAVVWAFFGIAFLRDWNENWPFPVLWPLLSSKLDWLYSLQPKKAEHQRIDASEVWWWRRLLRVPWTARRSNQSILKEISPEYSLEGLMLKLKLQCFGHLRQRTDSLKKTLMLGKTEGGEGDDRGWDGWMASPTQWTWVWVSSRSWWWTGNRGVLQPMGSQRVGHDWATELNWVSLHPHQHLMLSLIFILTILRGM